MHLKEMLDTGAIRPSSSLWAYSSHAGKKEGWETPFLYRCEKVELTDYQGCLQHPMQGRDSGLSEGCRLVHILGFDIRVLAS